MVLAPLVGHTFRLPTPRTSLVGRGDEVAAGRALLLDDAVPLLTLIGPGGTGKTRLALATADVVASAFADGVVFVDLAPLDDPARAVTGGTGPFAGMRGEILTTSLGFNETEGGNARYTVHFVD